MGSQNSNILFVSQCLHIAREMGGGGGGGSTKERLKGENSMQEMREMEEREIGIIRGKENRGRGGGGRGRRGRNKHTKKYLKEILYRESYEIPPTG